MRRVLPALVLVALCVLLAIALRREAESRARCDDGCVARGYELGLRWESRCLCAIDATDHPAPLSEQPFARGGR